MYRTFNMGIGLLVIVDEAKATDIRHHFEAVGEEAYIIGEIAPMATGETLTVEIRR
jgi:phosphoribosylformylglycinamidine cyclo-ligase